uniref:Uncharacterized protein n=1 Tax=Coccidioides posadasii RMSCC 3488 TaxID=454284 RepID=A0A0J6F6T1_COCPO|nr:hypothetical protein CPAG_04965 [Coccidioides posadasii RMSCC 3488]
MIWFVMPLLAFLSAPESRVGLDLESGGRRATRQRAVGWRCGLRSERMDDETQTGLSKVATGKWIDSPDDWEGGGKAAGDQRIGEWSCLSMSVSSKSREYLAVFSPIPPFVEGLAKGKQKKSQKRHEPWDAGAAPGIGRLRTLELRSNSGRQVLVGRCSQSGLRKWVVGAQPSGSSRLMESVKLCPLATERLACGLNQSSTGQPEGRLLGFPNEAGFGCETCSRSSGHQTVLAWFRVQCWSLSLVRPSMQNARTSSSARLLAFWNVNGKIILFTGKLRVTGLKFFSSVSPQTSSCGHSTLPSDLSGGRPLQRPPRDATPRPDIFLVLFMDGDSSDFPFWPPNSSAVASQPSPSSIHHHTRRPFSPR